MHSLVWKACVLTGPCLLAGGALILSLSAGGFDELILMGITTGFSAIFTSVFASCMHTRSTGIFLGFPLLKNASPQILQRYTATNPNYLERL